MSEWYSRTELLIGAAAMQKLKNARVAVIGLGGVGGVAAEALVRAGIGSVLLFDHDTVSPTNLNRQLFATTETIGFSKCEAGKRRLLSIVPDCRVETADCFYSAENRALLLAFQPDFVIDAIDTVSAKLDLAVLCKEQRIPSIVCLGTGNRMDPSAFQVGDIADTAGCGCGLARVMRRELKKRGITSQPVVYSTEPPAPMTCADSDTGRHPPASISFCPPVAGYLLAGYAVRQIIY